MTQEAPRPHERIAAAVSGWEYECCGEPLRHGAIGRFTLTPWNDGEPPSLPRGFARDDAEPTGAVRDGITPDGTVPVTSWIERHVISGEPRHVRARVTGLWTWGDESRGVPHRCITSMQKDEDARPAAPGPGWLVALDVLEELHPTADEVPFDGLG